jgi:hypothetical protein
VESLQVYFAAKKTIFGGGAAVEPESPSTFARGQSRRSPVNVGEGCQKGPPLQLGGNQQGACAKAPAGGGDVQEVLCILPLCGSLRLERVAGSARMSPSGRGRRLGTSTPRLWRPPIIAKTMWRYKRYFGKKLDLRAPLPHGVQSHRTPRFAGVSIFCPTCKKCSSGAGKNKGAPFGGGVTDLPK